MRHHPTEEATGHSPARKRWIPVARAPALREGTCGSSSNPDFGTGSNSKERRQMKKHLSKKRVVLAAIIAVALAIASGVAYAYWTSSGSGSSNAATAATAGDFDVTVTLTGALSPGASADVAGTVANNTGSSLNLAQVVGDSPLVTSDHAGCDSTTNPAWFTLGPLTLDDGAGVLADGASNDFSGTLTMNDSDTDNQDSCQGAAIRLHLKASSS
jgi:hypothetical protein